MILTQNSKSKLFFSRDNSRSILPCSLSDNGYFLIGSSVCRNKKICRMQTGLSSYPWLACQKTPSPTHDYLSLPSFGKNHTSSFACWEGEGLSLHVGEEGKFFCMLGRKVNIFCMFGRRVIFACQERGFFLHVEGVE